MTIASLFLAPPGFPAEPDIDAVIYEFGGDTREAIRALLADIAALAADAESGMSNGYVRGRHLKVVRGGLSGRVQAQPASPAHSDRAALAELMIGREAQEVADRIDAWRLDRLEPRVSATTVRNWLLGDDQIPVWAGTAIACELRLSDTKDRLGAEIELQRRLAGDGR